MPGRLRHLSRKVLARHAAPARAGGLRLAQTVAASRAPRRIVESSTRLARGRSIGRLPAAAAAPELPRPEGMSEFAARWIFGDGPAEGIPLAGEAALADIATEAGGSSRPSFLEERDAQEARAAEAEAARRAQPVLRGQVEEISPGGFKLARRPTVTQDPDPPAPETAAAQAVPAAPAVAVPAPSPPLPETGGSDAAVPPAGTEPSPAAATPRVAATDPPSGAPPVARPKLSALARQAEPDRAPRVPFRVLRAAEPARAGALPEPPAVRAETVPASSVGVAVASPAPGIFRRAVAALRGREATEAAAPAPPPSSPAGPAESRPAAMSPAETTTYGPAVVPESPRSPGSPIARLLHRARVAAPAEPQGASAIPAAAPPFAPQPASSAPAPTPTPTGAAEAGARPVSAVPSSESAAETSRVAESVLAGDLEEPTSGRPDRVPLELEDAGGRLISRTPAPGLPPTAPQGAGAVASDAGVPGETATPAPLEAEATSAPTRAPLRARILGRTRAPDAGATPRADATETPRSTASPIVKLPPVEKVSDTRVYRSAAPPAPLARGQSGNVHDGAAEAPRATPARATLVTRSGELRPSSGGPVEPSTALDPPRSASSVTQAGPAAGELRSPWSSRVAPGAERAPLRLVSAPAAARAHAASVARAVASGAPPESPQRGMAATSAARLAAATGATVMREADGTESVVFSRQSADLPDAALIMREADPGLPASPPGPSPAATVPAPAATPAPAPASEPAAGGGDIEEIYDQVIERLRRDLLADRERMGDVLGDLP